jgi:hypothetical protein
MADRICTPLPATSQEKEQDALIVARAGEAMVKSRALLGQLTR